MREGLLSPYDGLPRPSVVRKRRPWKAILPMTSLLIVGAAVLAGSSVGDDSAKRIDPATWGDDHVGKPLPSYVTGDECLFCHRKIGPAWSDNRHQLTIRPASSDEPAIRLLRELAGDDIAAKSRYLMGSRMITRFLKRSEKYGELDILSASFVPGKDANARGAPAKDGELKNSNSLRWDETTFGDRCAGCHTTAVKTETRSFSALSLDCFTCHGDVNLDHTKDVSHVLLSSQNRPSREVVSICGQCHLRGSRSKSSRLPYPNTFVAGDNLFRDFQVDFSDDAIDALPPVDQHIFLNARDVVAFGRSKSSCLTCHEVHGQSSEKHQQLDNTAICSSCHVAGTDNSKLRDAMLPKNRLQAHSRICDY